MKRSLLLCTLAAFSAFTVPTLRAQAADAPPVDVSMLLQELKKIRDQNDIGIRTRRNQALQQIIAAAGSPEKAAAFWKEAVKNAQFEGAEHEGQQVQNWREGEGEALNDKLCQGAVQLHLRWLVLSLQHAAGAENRQLLPQVIEFTKALQLDDAAAEHFNDQLDKAKERNDGKHGMAKKNVGEDATVKKVHDQVLRLAVGASPVARWLQLSDLLGEAGKKQKGGGGNTGWEATPGNLDGIYGAIILPEFRSAKDLRLLEYWDVVLKRETEKAAERKLDVEQRDWAQVKRPSILWNRAQDVLLLGFKNRAIGDMFNVVKSFPQHPEAPSWISQLENVLVPSAASAYSSTPPAASGTVPPPVAIPAATGGVPTATLVPTPPATGVRR